MATWYFLTWIEHLLLNQLIIERFDGYSFFFHYFKEH